MQNEALWYRRFGSPLEALTLESAALPALKPGTVRVRMISAPLNPSDLIPISGAYRHRVQPPLVAGYEGVGRVSSAEGAGTHLIGRRVLPLRGPGTWQRHVDCDPAWMVPVPDDIDTAVAARGYINPLAALRMLALWPVRGKRVLLSAAGAACARLIAQWALADGAREVIGLHRSPAHAGPLRGFGVNAIGMHDTRAVAAAAAGADLAFDAVGGPLANTLLASMRPGATFVSYGLLSGQPFAVPGNAPATRRFHLRDSLEAIDAQVWQGWFAALWPRLREAAMPDAVSFKLPDWRQAIGMFEQPGRQAKPMLDLQ